MGTWEDLNLERRVTGKEGGNLFYIKNKNLKYLMAKKVYKQKYFSFSWQEIQIGNFELRI